MNKKRPINLDLATIRFPVMAIASIFHRISGIGIFVLLPVIMWYLDKSLQSEASFQSNENAAGITRPYDNLVGFFGCFRLSLTCWYQAYSYGFRMGRRVCLLVVKAQL